MFKKNLFFTPGDPISCIHDNAISRHVINNYCWITYTFSLPDHYNKPIGSHVPHPGVAPDLGERRYHSYYQWVPFVLFFQVRLISLALIILVNFKLTLQKFFINYYLSHGVICYQKFK